ncbi:MAG: efflux RND transporter periplasmic adaptor subunit [Pseudomonadales bacterium]
MSRLPGRIAAVGLILASLPLAAAELLLSPVEIDNLGIELTAPQPAGRVSGPTGRGRVVIPPTGEFVVSAAQAGLLVRLHVAPGDAVSRGQLLAELRSPGFLATQREFLDAVAAEALARVRLAREEQLFVEGIVSRRRLEDARALSASAAAALAEHRQMLRIGGLTASDVDALARGRRLLELMPVRAPIDGVVLDLLATAGHGVDVTDPLYRIGDVSTLWLEIELPQDHVDEVAAGMAVIVDGAESVPARVQSVARAVDPQTQTVTVRAVIDGEDHRLRAGQFVTARIGAEDAAVWRDGVWSVPLASVVRSGAEHFVFVRSEGGFLVRPVQSLGAAGGRALVTGDLDAASRLATSGVAALKAFWSSQSDEDA